MKKLLRILLWTIAANVVLKAGAVAATRLLGEDTDDAADDFRLVALMDGRTYESVSNRLRSGRVIAALGGVDVDLRQAVLDPEGARLDVTVVAGGVRVLVCKSWRVEIEHTETGGAVQIEVPDPGTLPDGAPILHIHASAVAAGLVVANAESATHVVRS
jgi:predicted membrane protein